MFPEPPVIDFVPEREECLCGERLAVQKTRRKTVLTMTGPFIAREKVLECPSCFRIFVSDALLSRVQSRCNVAYDVLVFVGQALFQRYRTTQEVRIELIACNVRLSASEVNYLGRKFISYLAIGHSLATPRIRQKMRLAGGYVLHLDATHDGDAPALMTSMDSLSKIVLANVKLPSEHADYIVPFLRKLQSEYGTPRACVHDMGLGICKAVADVFPDIRDFVCHFHFLRDIGKDFLEPAYRELRNCLRNHAVSSRLHALVRETRADLSEQGSEAELLAKAIKAVVPLEDTGLLPIAATYSLALWALHGKKNGDGYGFPFDRPLLKFACLLLELNRLLPDLLNRFARSGRRDNQPLFKLARVVSDASKDLALCQAVEELRWRCLVFDRLREAMRIALVGSGHGLNDDGTAQAMTSIRQGVEQFRSKLEIDPKLAADPLCRKMAEQIDKYNDKLFADPIEVDTPNGTVTIYPQRTNNILEQFFRGIRRGQRRKTGNNSMSRTLQTMLADTPLVKNLDNPEYVKLLLDGKANLEELFAQLAAMPLTSDAESQADTDRILPGFRALINLPTLPDQVVRLFSEHLSMGKSN
ncbi:MAG: transposase [Dehalococcoidia bacterium]